jgi:hypothetical protein
MDKHNFDKRCSCYMCQAIRIKDRLRNENRLKIAKEFETLSNGIITKKDVLQILGGKNEK